MTKILSKIGFDRIKEIFDGNEIKKLSKTKDVEAVGASVLLNLAGVIIGNLPSCENEIYTFLSGVTGAKVEELREDSLADFAELIVAIFKKEEFRDFIGVVSKLFK